MIAFVDAHNHIHDARFASRSMDVIAECESLPIKHSVVNGTSPSDWSAVDEFAKARPWVVPSFGVHPWYIDGLPEDWLEDLKRRLAARPSGVGEIGIDHWREGLDRELQEVIFVQQLKLATDLNRPATIHGLKAWARLLELLRSHGAPKVGFLLHSYSGPPELVAPFVELGAYFSCAPAFLAISRHKKLLTFKGVPLSRLLPETDAPDQAAPLEIDRDQWQNRDGEPINRPGSISLVYQGLASLLGKDERELAETFEGNFARLFGEATIQNY